jgi:hypothetical protein
MAQFAPDLMVRYQSETNRLGVQFQYSQEGWKAIHNMLLDGAVDLILSTKLEHPQIEAAWCCWCRKATGWQVKGVWT